ncbi:PAS domain-containing protein [Winogradskyella sp. F6397]|uniref:PAS domain-containing protein n=1 Tax=Winogradskyella marina TaxID=2785530 RepID=A0ABS0EG27_9FLAO|nr:MULTISPECIES: PAS domain-containing protein [Winogradskyella]MBF8149399.1 PAS domain-containing protein [Winogradskyella marina]
MKHDLAAMNSLDIYLSNLTNEEYDKIKHKIGTRKSKSMPLLSWDIYRDGYHKRMTEAKKKIELEKVLSFAKQFNWQNDLEIAFAENDYEALIITDINQKIIWVNDGFTSMTGYSKSFALNKTPRFLQGEKTSLRTKAKIKSKIELNKPFKEVIVNHRKDKSIYKCEVKIIPLYHKETTHFIALEKQVV